MRVKSTICACCEYNLPYIIPNEYSNKTIGVFGDSFCALADIKNYNIVHMNEKFSHELSWLFFLGILSRSEIYSWGISGGSEYDILRTLLSNKTKYDSYIIFHTHPDRPNVTTNKTINIYKTLAAIETITKKEKNILHIFWNKKHEVYNFSKDTYCMEHILKKHPALDDKSKSTKVGIPNKNDQLDGHCHLSNRGNLLLAIEINKHLFSNDESI